MDKFKLLLRDLRRKDVLFAEATKIYLDACVEVKKIPHAGLVTHFSEVRDAENGGRSSALPGAGEDANSYSEEDGDQQPVLAFCGSHGESKEENQEVGPPTG